MKSGDERVRTRLNEMTAELVEMLDPGEVTILVVLAPGMPPTHKGMVAMVNNVVDRARFARMLHAASVQIEKEPS